MTESHLEQTRIVRLLGDALHVLESLKPSAFYHSHGMTESHLEQTRIVRLLGDALHVLESLIPSTSTPVMAWRNLTWSTRIVS